MDWNTVLAYTMPALGALALLFVGWIAAKWVSRIARHAFERAHVEQTLAKFFSKLIKWAILTFVIIGCLHTFGIEVTAFAAVIAAAGFAAGLAFQGTLSNFAAGVMLLIFRPFKVGDVVTVSGVTGRVDEIDLFVTYFDTADNRRFIVPNCAIFGTTIENVTHHSTRRVDVEVGTSYSADIDGTRDVLLRAVRAIPAVLADPEPAVVLAGLGATSIQWSVRVWVPADEYWAVKDSLARAVKNALDDASIPIPLQMHVLAGQVVPGK